MYYEADLDKIDLNSEPPSEEPARQYYFMAKCKEWVREFERKNGRPPTAFTQTFGCPKVNAPRILLKALILLAISGIKKVQRWAEIYQKNHYRMKISPYFGVLDSSLMQVDIL